MANNKCFQESAALLKTRRENIPCSSNSLFAVATVYDLVDIY